MGDTDPQAWTMEQIVGRNLATYRERRGLSQAELGRWIGVAGREWSRQAVHQAEAGRRSFAVADLVAITAGTGLTIGDLLSIPETVEWVDLGGQHPAPAFMLRDRMSLSPMTKDRIGEIHWNGYEQALFHVRDDVNRRIARTDEAFREQRMRRHHSEGQRATEESEQRATGGGDDGA